MRRTLWSQAGKRLASSCLLAAPTSGIHLVGFPRSPRSCCDRSAGPWLVVRSRTRKAMQSSASTPPSQVVATRHRNDRQAAVVLVKVRAER